MLYLIAIGMFILIVASTWWFGLWSGVVTLINLFIAAMLASSLYQPMSGKLSDINPTYEALFDFIGVWAVFCLAFFVLRGATDSLSRFRLKFDPLTEIIGRSIVSAWIAGVFICFESRSRGALAASKSAGGGLSEYKLSDHPDDAGSNKRVFDPYGEFLFEMEERRWELSKKERLRN